MAVGSEWRALFEQWPATLPRQGILVTAFQETIPFIEFRISAGLLLVERDRPDSHGGRKVMLPFESIAAIKLNDPGDLSKYQALGFDASR
jgi:hypothetical protein